MSLPKAVQEKLELLIAAKVLRVMDMIGPGITAAGIKTLVEDETEYAADVATIVLDHMSDTFKAMDNAHTR